MPVGHLHFFFEKIQFLCPFSNQNFFFATELCEFQYILDIKCLPNIWLANFLYHSTNCLFILIQLSWFRVWCNRDPVCPTSYIEDCILYQLYILVVFAFLYLPHKVNPSASLYVCVSFRPPYVSKRWWGMTYLQTASGLHDASLHPQVCSIYYIYIKIS